MHACIIYASMMPLRCFQVEGATVIDTNAGGLSGDKWHFLLHNLILLLVFRACVFFFLRYVRKKKEVKKRLRPGGRPSSWV